MKDTPFYCMHSQMRATRYFLYTGKQRAIKSPRVLYYIATESFFPGNVLNETETSYSQTRLIHLEGYHFRHF